jgi:hypothetical protein
MKVKGLPKGEFRSGVVAGSGLSLGDACQDNGLRFTGFVPPHGPGGLKCLLKNLAGFGKHIGWSSLGSLLFECCSQARNGPDLTYAPAQAIRYAGTNLLDVELHPGCYESRSLCLRIDRDP